MAGLALAVIWGLWIGCSWFRRRGLWSKDVLVEVYRQVGYIDERFEPLGVKNYNFGKYGLSLVR